jgi:hypothetical protein
MELSSFVQVHVIESTWVDGVYLKQAQLLDVDLREAGSNSRYFKMQKIYCHSYWLHFVHKFI